MQLASSAELVYVGLLFSLFVVPRLLQRWRIPAAITAVSLGAIAGPGFHLLERDSTVGLLSTLGIVSLFLFAGLEVEARDLRRQRRVLAEHLLLLFGGLVLVAWIASRSLGLQARPAMLVALAVLTPSTGFILDSLPGLGLSPTAAYWVRTKAIAAELLALGVMFVVLQSASAGGMALSSAALLGMVALLPRVFRVFARFIVPHAPKTEFSFLLLVSVICALVTKHLGVYYLVGAFIVGMVAQGFRRQLPAIASEKMLHAVEAFASIFVPFYFFHAGLVLRADDFSLGAVGFGLLLLLVAIPLRILLVGLHRGMRFREELREGLQVSIPMIPTLVFTLVVANILRERFDTPRYVFGGLVVYALVNTILPSMIFRSSPPGFDAPEPPAP